MTKNELLQKLETLGPTRRSAWDKAVLADAYDLAEALEVEVLPDTWPQLRKLLLNGAADWRAYSYGGCALYQARRLIKEQAGL